MNARNLGLVCMAGGIAYTLLGYAVRTEEKITIVGQPVKVVQDKTAI